MKTTKFKALALLLVLAISSGLYAQQSEKILYGNNPDAGHYVQAGDAKLYCEVYGRNETFVLLHGWIMGAPLTNALKAADTSVLTF